MAAHEVKVGDRTYTVGNLSGFKMLRAGSLLTSIMREVPELSEEISAFSRRYSTENTVKIPRAAAELRFAPEELARVSAQGWEDGDGFLELPGTPGPMEIAAFALPKAFDAAEERVLDLLALIVTPNSTLRTAVGEEGGVTAELKATREVLIHEDAAELVDLLGAVADVIESQFSGKIAVLRRVGSLFGLSPKNPETETETTATTPKTDSSPNGSTDSPAPTDGPETTGSGSASAPSEPALTS